MQNFVEIGSKLLPWEHGQTDRQTHTYTHRDHTSDLIICPMLCYSNGSDNNHIWHQLQIWSLSFSKFKQHKWKNFIMQDVNSYLILRLWIMQWSRFPFRLQCIASNCCLQNFSNTFTSTIRWFVSLFRINTPATIFVLQITCILNNNADSNLIIWHHNTNTIHIHIILTCIENLSWCFSFNVNTNTTVSSLAKYHTS